MGTHLRACVLILFPIAFHNLGAQEMRSSRSVLALLKCRWADEQKGRKEECDTESECWPGVVLSAPGGPLGHVVQRLSAEHPLQLLDRVQSIWDLSEALEYLLGLSA